MKLPSITYRAVSAPQSLGPQAAVSNYRAKQSILQAGIKASKDIAAKKTEEELAASSTVIANDLTQLKTSISGMDRISRGDLVSLGATEDNVNIQWTSPNGEAVEEFKRHDVEAALTAQFLEDRIKKYGSNIASPQARRAWESTTRKSASDEVLRVSERAASDAEVYNFREASAAKDALVDAGDYDAVVALIETSSALTTRPDVKEKWLSEARDGLLAKVSPELEEITDEGVRAAREGNGTAAAAAMKSYSLMVNDLRSKGVIADSSVSSQMIEDYGKRLAIEEIRTDFRQNLDTPSKQASASLTISKFRDLDVDGYSVAEQEAIFKTLVSDLNTHVSLNNKKEDADTKATLDVQKVNERELLIGIVDGSKDQADVLSLLSTGAIRTDNADKYLSALNSRGNGVNDWGIIREISIDTRNIQSDDDANAVIQSITGSIGVNLTERKASELIADVNTRQDEESPLRTNSSRRAEDYIVKSIRIVGAMAALDPKAERKLAEAQRKYSTLVLEGMSPWDAADKVVGTVDLERAESSLFFDYPGAVTLSDVEELLRQKALAAKDLKGRELENAKAEIDYKYGLLEDVRLKRQARDQFDAGREE